MWKPENWRQTRTSAKAAFWFATFLCLMMLGGSLLPFLPSNPAFPAFFSFLPVVFLMIAQDQKEKEKVIRALQARLDALEAASQKPSSG
jgi:hypothetical protein